MTMIAKRKSILSLLIPVIVSFVLLVTGLGTTFRAVCGCGPIDLDVQISLSRLDALVRRYAAEHGGAYPTYAELSVLAVQRDARWITTDVRVHVIQSYLDEQSDLLTNQEQETIQSYHQGVLTLEQVADRLDQTHADQLVRRYQLERRRFPTYEDFVEQAQQEYDDHTRLTPQVDWIRKAFRVSPRTKGAVGYAVSSDRRDYLLLGAGWGRRQWTWFGIKLFSIGEGVRILHPYLQAEE
jgi:hypothetical protein